MTDLNQDIDAPLAGDTDVSAIAEAMLNDIELGVEALDNNNNNNNNNDDDDLAGLEEMPTEVLSAETEDNDLGIDRAALYADQGDGEMSVADPEDTQAVQHTPESLKASTSLTPPKRGRKAPATPGASAVATTRSQALKKKSDVTGLLSLGYDQGQVDAMMETIDAAPKKVGEKANNLIRYALGREHVSNFTRFTLGKLRDNPEGFTVPTLVQMMQDERSYSVGTARSQAQQQSRLFGLFGMVSKDGSKITLDADNPLSKAVLSRLAGGPFIAPQAAPDLGDNEEQAVEAEAVVEPEVETEAQAPSPTTTRAARRAAAKAKKAAAKQGEKELLAA